MPKTHTILEGQRKGHQLIVTPKASGWRLLHFFQHGNRGSHEPGSPDHPSALWRHAPPSVKAAGSYPRRDRDFQRAKVYTAERVAFGEQWSAVQYQTLRECAVFLQSILELATVQRRWGLREVEVRSGAGHRHARGGPGFMVLPAWSRNQPVILHELAHCLCPYWERHGRLFARTYVELLRLARARGRISTDIDPEELVRQYRVEGVKMNPRRRHLRADGAFRLAT